MSVRWTLDIDQDMGGRLHVLINTPNRNELGAYAINEALNEAAAIIEDLQPRSNVALDEQEQSA